MVLLLMFVRWFIHLYLSCVFNQAHLTLHFFWPVTGFTHSRLNRASQTYFFPVHLTDQLLPSAVFYATVGPLVIYFAMHRLIIKPYLRAQKERWVGKAVFVIQSWEVLIKCFWGSGSKAGILSWGMVLCCSVNSTEFWKATGIPWKVGKNLATQLIRVILWASCSWGELVNICHFVAGSHSLCRPDVIFDYFMPENWRSKGRVLPVTSFRRSKRQKLQ